jgi:hypothetical protein
MESVHTCDAFIPNHYHHNALQQHSLYIHVMHHTHTTSLPSYSLVQVFRFLTIKYLKACRLTCRDFRRVFDTHPYAWSLIPILHHDAIDLFECDDDSSGELFVFPSLRYIFSRIMTNLITYLQNIIWKDDPVYQVNERYCKRDPERVCTTIYFPLLTIILPDCTHNTAYVYTI